MTATTLNRWMGHIRLCFDDLHEEMPEDCARVALAALGEHGPRWMHEGGGLALRALAPLAALGGGELRAMSILLCGPGAGLAAYVAVELGFGRVALTPWPGSEETAAVLAPLNTKVEWLDPASAPAPAAQFHRILLGQVPQQPDAFDLAAFAPLLKPEGELALYGMPADQLPPFFESLATRGFALRAAGSEDDKGFLSGSLEQPGRFTG